ncbi:hypothetical protein P8452_22379 [Trifolium repens]|nr:hypothetical protein P8452_22379 [Trifolium repens]
MPTFAIICGLAGALPAPPNCPGPGEINGIAVSATRFLLTSATSCLDTTGSRTGVGLPRSRSLGRPTTSSDWDPTDILTGCASSSCACVSSDTAFAIWSINMST